MRAVIKFVSLQGKAPKEIHSILTETLACFLPGQAKDLSTPLYLQRYDWCCLSTDRVWRSMCDMVSCAIYFLMFKNDTENQVAAISFALFTYILFTFTWTSWWHTRARESVVWILARARHFLFSKTCRLVLGPTQHPTLWVSQGFFPRAKAGRAWS